MDTQFCPWSLQSPITDPGPAATPSIDALPSSLSSLRHASSQLVFHYHAGDFAKDKVPTSRKSEINLRYASTLLDTVLSRGPEATLLRDRAPVDRVVGCCRDAVVLFLALARHKGIPARGRVGFATYIRQGWYIDHVVAEVWDEGENRWRLVETELEEGVEGVDYLDVTEEQFITGPRAWRLAREGAVDAARFVVSPALDLPILRGWPYLAHNVLHDLVWWDKKEMLLWDYWGVQGDMKDDATEVPEGLARVLDGISAATGDSTTEWEDVRTLLSRDGLDVPRGWGLWTRIVVPCRK
jgi:hypothetical protein